MSQIDLLKEKYCEFPDDEIEELSKEVDDLILWAINVYGPLHALTLLDAAAYIYEQTMIKMLYEEAKNED